MKILCRGAESNRILIFFRDPCAPATLPRHRSARISASLRSQPLLVGKIIQHLYLGFSSLSIGIHPKRFLPFMAFGHYAKHNCPHCHPSFPFNLAIQLLFYFSLWTQWDLNPRPPTCHIGALTN